MQEVSYTPYSLCWTSRALEGVGGGVEQTLIIEIFGKKTNSAWHSSCLRRFLILFLIPTMVACPKTSLKRTPALKSVIASSSQAPGASFMFLAIPLEKCGVSPWTSPITAHHLKASWATQRTEALTHWLGWGKTRRLLKSSQSQQRHWQLPGEKEAMYALPTCPGVYGFIKLTPPWQRRSLRLWKRVVRWEGTWQENKHLISSWFIKLRPCPPGTPLACLLLKAPAFRCRG